MSLAHLTNEELAMKYALTKSKARTYEDCLTSLNEFEDVRT